MFLEAAFNQILKLQSKEMTYYDNESKTSTTIYAAPSNYFRNLSAPEEIVIKGKEFVISKKELDSKSLGIPKRGHILIDSDLGNNPIVEVREMIVMSKLIGFRVRTH